MDTTAVLGSITGISAPSFFMAIIIAYLFGIILHTYTGLNLTGSLYEIDDVTGERYLVLKNLVLPAITLGIRPLAIITQLTRSSMLDVLGQDYIRTARAKGLGSNSVTYKHAFRNASLPLVASLGGLLPALIGGAGFVEVVFAWPGLTPLLLDSLAQQDVYVIVSTTAIASLLYIVGNLVSDLLLAAVDPRIRFS